MTVLDTLRERGFLQQLTHESEIAELLSKEKITFYIGFDPTADSLHVGHFLGMMVMAHMQQAGHRPVCLIGGGTSMVGDPSGKTAECFKQRLNKGLSFLEFNYMLMQAYDFLALNRQCNCIMQMGGDDQWSNILAGADLIRRKENKLAYGLTFTLLTTSDGRKMGKTEKGALWLDAEKTSPYDFYQYWRNINDADVEKCLALLTFMPMDEVRRLGALQDKEINIAKKTLAFEVTKLIHGQLEAEKAGQAAEALFGGAGTLDNAPTVTIAPESLGTKIIDILTTTGIVPSKSEGRRLIQQGGLYIDDTKVTDLDFLLTVDLFADNSLLIRKGKKNYHRLVIK